MLQGGNIAFFIDVDNVGLSTEHYANVIEQLNGMGTILYGKIYGAGERKHKDIYAEADYKGYKMERPMRIKRRGRKEFDARIFVDVVDAITRTPAIDAVCIIAQPTDLVYLYSYLHGRGIKIIALDNADDASCSFIDEVIDLGIVLQLKLPKIAPVGGKNPTSVQQPTNDDLDRTDALLREIERLKYAVEPEEQSAHVQDEQPVVEQDELVSIVEEANALLDKIAEMQETVDETAEPTRATTAPRSSHTPANDGDLIRRIEEIRKGSDSDDDDLVDEIRKLLEGLE